MSSHHDILGVLVTATQEEIRTAFKRAAMKHHPDRPEGSADVFAQITASYKVLSKQKCSACTGKGFVTERHGAFIKKIKCPICWRGK